MIKPSELRIGNLIQCDLLFNAYAKRKPYCGKYIYGISAIFSRSVKIDVGYDSITQLDESEIQPILLTEDWLLKFGFKNIHVNNKHYVISDPNGYKDSHKISIFPTINDKWQIAFSDSLSGNERCYIPSTTIKSVHQLQNLYFALTGEELTLKQQV